MDDVTTWKNLRRVIGVLVVIAIGLVVAVSIIV
jgi:hypothetical protein